MNLERINAAILRAELECIHWRENRIGLEHVRKVLNTALHAIDGTKDTIRFNAIPMTELEEMERNPIGKPPHWSKP